MSGIYRLFGLLTIALVVSVTDALPPQKIVGGTAAATGEFPYQALLRLHGQFLCGGAIIGARHIITAAHCLTGVARPYTQLRIVTGSVSSYGGQSHTVKSVFSHEKYNAYATSSPNDIAIIVLAADIKFDKNQDKVKLPTASTPSGVRADATGWGYTSASNPRTVTNLMKVRVTTLEPAQCQKYLRSSTIYTHQICTYDTPGRGVCQGDSGGPLVSKGELIGIVSYGIPCAIGYPDVFTSVYHYLDWIKKIIADNP